MSIREKSFPRPPSTHVRHAQTELRRQEDSRSRSRDARSKHSWSSAKSNRSSGPLTFGGNTAIKKSERTDDKDEILSKPEFTKPLPKMKNTKDRNIDDDYAALVW